MKIKYLKKNSRKKNYYNEYLLVESKFKKFQKKNLSLYVNRVFSLYIRLALSETENRVYKNIIQRNNLNFSYTILGTLKQLLIFIFFSMPLRLLQRKKMNIVSLYIQDISDIFKFYYTSNRIKNLIIEQNTGFILNFFLSILIKRSKLIKDLKSSFYVSKKKGLNYLLKNQDKIESQIKKLLFISDYFLKLTRVNKIITSDASSIRSSIIAMSAKKNDIEVHEFFHGYYSGKDLIGVYPTLANFQYHWTQEIINSFQKYIPNNFTKKQISFGYPINFIKNSKSKFVLILFPDINFFNKKKISKMTNQILKLIKILSRFVNVRVRPHPASRNNVKKKYSKLITSYGGVLSYKKSVVDDLKTSMLVLGNSSSVLVTAFNNDIPSLRLKDDDNFYCDNVPEMSYTNIVSFFKSRKEIIDFCKYYNSIIKVKKRNFDYTAFAKAIR